MGRVWALLVLLPLSAQAESLVATHTLRAASTITEADVVLVDAEIPGAVMEMSAALGLELREAVYAGRPVLLANLAPPAVVERNQIVQLTYQSGPLAIVIEGRALSRGAVGDVIRVMNTASHATVSGLIGADGTISVNTTKE
jgi:flagellar basal body P-ring formation protein FlgA